MKAMTRRFKKMTSTCISIALAMLLSVWMLPIGTQQAYGLSSSDSTVLSWNGAKKGSNYVFTLETDGNTNSAGGKTFNVVYDDGTQGNSSAFQTTWDCSAVKSGWYQDINGATIATSGATVTITIPSSYFANDNFTVSFGGSSITSVKMGGGESAKEPESTTDKTPATGTDKTPDQSTSGSSSSAGSDSSSDTGSTGGSSASDESAESGSGTSGSYNGIVIDGDFSDWDSIKKYDVSDVDQNGNPKGWDTVNKMAMVWDGDWVYLYFESNADDPGAMSGAGPWNNGQYAITTDLGNQTLIQLSRGPAVSGVNGATVAANNYEWAKTPHKWEVAIPASTLGSYKESISFGMYQVDPTITGVTNLKGSTSGDFSGITYDGVYTDWEYYPHTTIEYATAGTSDHVVDSKGALYADSAQQKLFGHASTTMPAHLDERGGEFTSAVSIRINGDNDLMVTPRFAAVDANGNINWNPQLSGLADGTYEFYLFSTTCWGNSQNINNLNGSDVCYGKATITIQDGRQDMEWYMDIPTLAANLHANWGQNVDATSIDPNDIKLFESQYGRLGQQWVSTAGTSTAPFVGIGLGIAVVIGVLAYRRYKRRNNGTPATATAESL